MRNRLFQLLIDNKDKPKKFEIEAMGNESATIYLYDAIDPYFGVGAKEFNKELAALNVGEINLRINSPGGDVFDGRAIQSALIEHPANVIVHIDGLAASAATTVALAGNERQISPGAFFMIHKGWTLNIGNADEFMKTASLLNKVDAAIAMDYANIANMSNDEALRLMSDETWYSADEALATGFVDKIKDGTSAKNNFDLSAYKNAPKQKATNQYDQHRARMLARLSLAEKMPA